MSEQTHDAQRSPGGTDEVAPRDVVRIDQSPVRCPFCHGDVQVAADEWVACAACLGRHHRPCWSEAGRCGACGGGEFLSRTAQAEPAPPRAEPAPPRAEPAAEPEPGRYAPWDGTAPRMVGYTREVEGEVDSSVDERIILECRRQCGVQGRIERLGATLTWDLPPPFQQTIVTVSARDGRTRIEVRANVAYVGCNAYLFGFMPTILAALMAYFVVVLHGPVPWLLAPSLLVAGVALGLRWSRRRLVGPLQERRRAFAGLADALEREVRDHLRPRRDPKSEGTA